MFEHAIKDVNDSLEMELLYATECIYSKLKAENKAGKIGKVMQDLWDSYSFNKSTLLVEWKSERSGQVMFRGTREFWKKVFLTNFIQKSGFFFVFLFFFRFFRFFFDFFVFFSFF